MTVIPMGGGEHAARHAPVRTDLLSRISHGAPVPHLFLLDRGERSRAEIEGLDARLGARLHLWQRRELENYMLVPRVLLAALRSKYKDQGVIKGTLDGVNVGHVDALITRAVSQSRGLVLLKRIRSEIGGLREGLLAKTAAEALSANVSVGELAALIRSEIEKQLRTHLATTNLERIVQEQCDALDSEWTDEARRLEIAPGEEVVDAVFRNYGGRYEKPEDTVRVAEQMTDGDITGEVRELIAAVARMASAVA